MADERTGFRRLIPRYSRAEWEGVAIACAAVALWFFQRFMKTPRRSGPFMIRSVFLYALIPFALHALFALAGARRRYAGLVLAALGAGSLAARFAFASGDAAAWVVLGAGAAVSVPLFFWCDVRDLGVRLGEGRLWLPVVLAGWAATAVGIAVIAGTPAFQKSYPYVPFHPGDVGAFAFEEAVEMVDMFDWEFLFRGFLLFTLAPRLGVVPAILVQGVLFAGAHVNKPELEIYGSIVGGVLLGHLCWQVRSMLPAFVAHQLVFLSAEIAAVIVKRSR